MIIIVTFIEQAASWTDAITKLVQTEVLRPTLTAFLTPFRKISDAAKREKYPRQKWSWGKNSLHRSIGDGPGPGDNASGKPRKRHTRIASASYSRQHAAQISFQKKNERREQRAEKYEILSTLMVRANALLRVLRLARWWLDSCSFGAFLAPILARGFCQDVHLFAH